MKIALVCPYAWDAPGGVQVHVRELARVLSGRGHDVLVLAPGRVDAADLRVVRAGRPIRVPYRGTVAPVAPSPTARPRIRRILARFDPDVVHVHEPFTPSTSMWAVLASEAPVVATFHSYLDRSRAMELARPLLKRVERRLAVAIAVSEAAADFEHRVFPELRIEVVPNGVDVRAFADAAPEALPEGRRVVWVHRLDPQKGFRVMVDAFPRVFAAVPDARLIVAGDGGDRSLVRALPSAVRERVVMLGAVTHDRVPGLLRAADVAVAPATGQESFGYTLVEAMAAGAAVVATDIPGYREVARDDLDALLVPPSDPDALARAIVRVLDDEALRERLVRAGHERAMTFDWGSVVERLEALYRRALDASLR